MRKLTFLAVMGVTALGITSARADDWSRFRGPNGTGVADPKAPIKWSNNEGLLWKTAIPGHGHSSPIIVGDRLFLESASDDSTKRMLICVNVKTGKIDWTKTVAGGSGKTHKKNTLASSTPACDGENVYAVFWDGKAVSMHAYTVEGKELWSASLGSYESQHGAAMSPVAYKGKVYLNFDQDGAAEIVAFDGKTGAKVWAAPRKAFRACPSTPLIRDLGNGTAELVVGSTAGITGYDPETGKVNWTWNWSFPNKPLRTVGSPLLVDGTVVVVSGDGDGSRNAAAVTAGTDPKLLWQAAKETPYVPGPLAKGSHLYWITDDGFATCADQKSGKIVWRERVFAKGVTASPVMIGDAVLAIAEDGKTIAFKASPDGYEKLAEASVGEPVLASPAVAQGKLFIRGSEHLFCYGKK